MNNQKNKLSLLDRLLDFIGNMGSIEILIVIIGAIVSFYYLLIFVVPYGYILFVLLIVYIIKPIYIKWEKDVN